MFETNPFSHLADAHGVLLRRDAEAAGVDDNALARAVRAGHLLRLRHGAYVLREVMLAADDAQRHVLLCRAVMKRYDDHVALSHGSACLAMGGPDYGLDLANAHVTHLAGGGRKESRIVHHRGGVRVTDLRRHDDHWITTQARAAMDTARLHGVEVGLVQACHFLHEGTTSLEALAQTADAQQFWPHSIVHHPILTLANSAFESVGEVRSAWMFFRQGLPRPEQQVEVRRPDGSLVGRVDFAWPERKVVVEFDGLAKYHRYRRVGESIEAMVVREKRREDEIRRLTGWTVIRIVWSDLGTPVATCQLIRSAFTRPVLLRTSGA